MDVIGLIARILLALVFVASGLMGHLGPGRAMMTGYAQGRGLPAAGFLVPFSGAWIVVGSLFVVLGLWGDIGALMLAAFVVSTALLMHPYWKETDQGQKMMEQVQFNKDLALAGGALALFVMFAGLGPELGLTLTGPVIEL